MGHSLFNDCFCYLLLLRLWLWLRLVGALNASEEREDSVTQLINYNGVFREVSGSARSAKYVRTKTLFTSESCDTCEICQYFGTCESN